MSGSCQCKNVKWPNETSTTPRPVRGNSEHLQKPLFAVDFAPPTDHYSIYTEIVDGVEDKNCCAAIVCQEIK